jgi:hypothetical protein
MNTDSKFILWHTILSNELTQLKLIKEEHTDFKNLIERLDFTYLNAEQHIDSLEILDVINTSEKKVQNLISEIVAEIDDLQRLFNNKRTFSDYEQHCIDKQNVIAKLTNAYINRYNIIKAQILVIVKRIKQEESTRQLINRKDILQPLT